MPASTRVFSVHLPILLVPVFSCMNRLSGLTISMARSRRTKLIARDSDIIIPVIGLNGAGKSTFINTAMDQAVTRVSDGLFSCTSDIQSVAAVDPRDQTRRVIFVDTPGFNHTFVSDTEILRRITDWLRTTYNDKKTVTGIIYLWDISQTRDTARHILDIFCIPKPPRNVIVATTKWSVPSTNNEGERCTALQNYLMTDVPQFTNTRNSAWEIVDRVIRQESFDAKRLRALVERLEGYSQTRTSRLGADFVNLFKTLLSKRQRPG